MKKYVALLLLLVMAFSFVVGIFINRAEAAPCKRTTCGCDCTLYDCKRVMGDCVCTPVAVCNNCIPTC